VLLPRDKLERFQQGVANLQQQRCPKLHRSLVGQLASFGPALQLDPF
jgi:hypothetical protein